MGPLIETVGPATKRTRSLGMKDSSMDIDMSQIQTIGKYDLYVCIYIYIICILYVYIKCIYIYISI